MFDYIITALLVALALVFGFFTRRAYRSKRPIVKWGGTVTAALLTLAAGSAVGAILIGYWQLNRTYDNPVVNLNIARTAERVARGERLTRMCVGCHAPDTAEAPVGRDFLGEDAPPIGHFYAPNLTPAHLAEWSDGEIVRAIREGVHRSGRSLLIMPSSAWRNLSDEDVYSIVAYLRSLPAQGIAMPPNRLNALGAVMSLFLPIREVQPHIEEPVLSPPRGPTAAYGAYVSSFTCQACHGPDLLGNPDIPAPPLVAIPLAWSEEEFVHFIRTGLRPDGSSVNGEAMPWSDLSNILNEDDEVRGVYAYLVEVGAEYVK
jgi:mono/diheme cytochrome c family protein